MFGLFKREKALSFKINGKEVSGYYYDVDKENLLLVERTEDGTVKYIIAEINYPYKEYKKIDKLSPLKAWNRLAKLFGDKEDDVDDKNEGAVGRK